MHSLGFAQLPSLRTVANLPLTSAEWIGSQPQPSTYASALAQSPGPLRRVSSALTSPAFTVAFSAAAALGASRRRRCRAMATATRKKEADANDPPRPGKAEEAECLDVVIVGGGISGLSAAFGLGKNAPAVSFAVTEARDRVGGNITTRSENGRIWEEGPSSYQPEDKILETACDVGLKDEILLADPGSYRFVWWDGQLRALPASPVDAVFGDFLSFPGKIRAGLGIIGWKDPMPDNEESIKEFITRNLGSEAFERLIDPFVSGVFAGDPASLSAEAAIGKVQSLEQKGGSLFAGGLQMLQEKLANKKPRDPRLPEVKGQTVGNFRGGLGQFAGALASNAEKKGSVRTGWTLRGLTWNAERREHLLEYDTPSGPRRLHARSVILTAPSYVTADLLRPMSEESAAALDEIKYPTVAAVTVEYPRSAFREPEHGKGPVNGFGQLHPRSQGIRTLGTIYVSSLFENRVPDPNKVMLLHYIGGARDPELFGGIGDMNEGQLVEATHKDAIQTLLKPSAAGTLPEALSARIWPQAIPQSNLGHNKRLDRVKEGLKDAGVEGLFLAGNFVGGPALARCVDFGQEVAAEAAAFVQSSPANRV